MVAVARSMTFEACYRVHRPRVYRLSLRYAGGRKSWAEDLTHDVFVKLLEHFPRLTAHDDLGGWLYRVTAHLAISRIRREQTIVGKVWHLVAGEEAIDPSLDERVDATAVLSLLRRLPARERVALCMKVLDGKSQREIAESLSISEGYASKLVARAWKRVRGSGWETDEQA